MSRRALGCLLLLGLAAGPLRAASAPADPRVVLEAAGRLTVSRLPPLLADAGVRRHLDSGLTTSLVLQGGPQGDSKRGAARVDVRFELWDEVYLVTVIDGEGAVERLRPESFELLASWWAKAEIVLSADAGAGAAARQARVSLAVVPFSQAELVDTQRWLAESIGQARGGSGDARRGSPDAVGALIATSMQRRAVQTLVWTVPIERRPRP